MNTRLLIAYILMALLASGAIAAIWAMIHNSPRQRMRWYYRRRREPSNR